MDTTTIYISSAIVQFLNLVATVPLSLLSSCTDIRTHVLCLISPGSKERKEMM